MKNKKNTILGFLFSVFLLSFSLNFNEIKLKDTDKILDILVKLGDEKPLHFKPFSELDKTKIFKGKEIIKKGFTTRPNGKKTKKQSKHFVCVDCHNTKQEDPDLRFSNPETRLKYAVKNNIRFLQGTTMYGTVNRKHWYNDDYYKKYGDLVVSAKDTLKNAIHLCATVCSQGRDLDDFEMEAVMEYFLSIGYNIKDLNLSESEKFTIEKTLQKGIKSQQIIDIIKSKYLDYSPATFLKPIPKKERKLGKGANAQNGEKIFELSCLPCHNNAKNITNYKLSKGKLDMKHLKFWSGTKKRFSVYEMIREGTYPMNGYHPYMPLYTKERMSDQQIEDLVEYINRMAKNGTIKKKYRTTITPSF